MHDFIPTQGRFLAFNDGFFLVPSKSERCSAKKGTRILSSRSIVTIAILIAISGSLSADTSDSPFRQPRFEVKKSANIIYGQGLVKLPTPGSKELLLDLYEPQGKELPLLRPAMIVIHGGGFKGGSRGAGNMASLCSEFASRGFVCVSIDYRTQGDDPDSDGNTLMERSIRAAVQDAGKALDWMVNKAKELQVDAKRIAIGGGSAGAITSLLLTYSKGTRAGRAPVAAVIDLWGSLYRSSGDIERGDPPVLIIHGVNDNIVPFSGAQDIVNRTKEVGVVCELYAIEDAGHGVNLNKEIDGVTLLQRIVNFLDTQLKLSELP